MAMLKYDDLSDSQLDLLQDANLRYHHFLGHGGELNEQAHQDRATYPHLLTVDAAGNGYVSDEKAIEFLIAVTSLPRDVCTAYQEE